MSQILRDVPGSPSASGMSENYELISVVVPLHNHEEFIGDCLSSVQAQTYPNIELIIVDDASTDASFDFAQTSADKLSATLNRVTIIRNRYNKGLADSRNAGISESRGHCIFFLDSDNQLYPRALARLHEALRFKGADFAYTQLELFDEDTGVGGADVWDPVRLARGNYIDAMALITKEALVAVGCFSHMRIPGWEDYDLWCKLARGGFKGIYIPEMLCRYRVRATSMVRAVTNMRSGEIIAEMRERHPWIKLA